MKPTPHTPTPDAASPQWMTGGIFMPDSKNPTCNIWGPPPPGVRSGDIILSNVPVKTAALIVRAVNAHAGLLAALEAARRIIADRYLSWANAGGENECSHGYGEGVPCRKCDEATVTAAIAQAKEGK